MDKAWQPTIADIRFVPIADVHARSQVLAVRKAGVANPLAEAFLDKLRAQVTS